MVKAGYGDLQIERSPTGEEPQKTDFAEIGEAEPLKGIAKWKWAAVLLLFLAFFAGALSPPGKRMFSQFIATIPSTYKTLMDIFLRHPATAEDEVERDTPAIAKMDPGKSQKPIYDETSNEKTEKAEIEEVPSDEKVASEKSVQENTEKM